MSAGPGSDGFTLTLPDLPYSYRIDDTGLYAVRLRGRDVAHVMFSSNCQHQSVAMIAMVEALNQAVAS